MEVILKLDLKIKEVSIYIGCQLRCSRPKEIPWSNPYEIGVPTNDGSVEIDPRNFPKDNAEPVFKNKIEEAIYRAKRK